MDALTLAVEAVGGAKASGLTYDFQPDLSVLWSYNPRAELWCVEVPVVARHFVGSRLTIVDTVRTVDETAGAWA